MYICQLINREGCEENSEMYEFFIMRKLSDWECLLEKHCYEKGIDRKICNTRKKKLTKDRKQDTINQGRSLRQSREI